MNSKTKAVLVLVVLGAVLAGVLIFNKTRSPAGVRVTLRVAVTPAEQAAFVTAEANSARFKYMVGKISGIKPMFAQKLSAKTLPNSSLVEVEVSVETKDEARRYVDEFVKTLQGQCAGRAQLSLAEHSVR